MNAKGQKVVVLGVASSIAAYKAANLASMLRKRNYDVHVIITKNATEFISPLVFETLTNNVCVVDQFSRTGNYEVEHVALAKQADVVLIAPATANVMAKIANGLADDALTTQVLACTCPKIVAPAMNTNMYLNPITQDNIKKLEHYGFTVVTPASGLLACRDVGIGKFPEESLLADYVDRAIAKEKDFVGKKVVVTAGATQEAIDPVRFITNHSSGKMGFAIAKEFMLRGADVTLIAAANTQPELNFVNTVKVKSARDMFEAVKENSDADIIVKAAAVADYTPTEIADNKIKKKDGDMAIPLKRTQDILKWLGENKRENQMLVGFSMETENLIENSRAKLTKKNADMIVANNLKVEGAGFGVDTNVVTIITKDEVKELPLMSKADVASALADEIKKRL
ncbi:MAG: bifunctional phosphopantothenoylcysteine decarboxylase/phosphopantothenate--cysteine ligase CoaBC [Clostridia bacterium]|nr:bifunctional phosphopantothenoylcysteine decarboxylase/phosphopantothenate--cysteine ligase CoaBC [Clostridia bacterium]